MAGFSFIMMGAARKLDVLRTVLHHGRLYIALTLCALHHGGVPQAGVALKLRDSPQRVIG
eukprot:CAMPEP_0204553600 /NCGR_PEP_ID=MMETSP0661-20131031/27485_1 /ASSEMBLY_ACC=CAM_ASM_000606 /TAXON_ID=109239 /ORGANISM="Alexandrium margalefi, Strain AMGDE01CS-322" /LENGTH=59 /DNA_ID=CAMNT_0051560643 /DNA_START=50 /DNA_END=226 /DNA_ORIENTATION=+